VIIYPFLQVDQLIVFIAKLKIKADIYIDQMDYFNDYGFAGDYGKIYNISKYKNICFEFEGCELMFPSSNIINIFRCYLTTRKNIHGYTYTYKMDCNRRTRLQFYISNYKYKRRLIIYK